MNLKLIKRLIDDSLSLGVIHINFTGGEPLLRKEIYELIKYSKVRGAIASVTTNGLLLTKKNIKRLKESGLDVILISLDSPYKYKHDNNRKFKGCYDNVINAIKLAKKEKLKIILNSVITKKMINSNEIHDLVSLSHELDAPLIFVAPVPIGKWNKKYTILLNNNEKKKFQNLIKKNENIWSDIYSSYIKHGCAAGSEKIGISAFGDVNPCPAIQMSFGNIKNESLKKIWEKLLLTKEFNQQHSFCLATERGFIEKYKT
jgi:MoaA/NifB/PqqE/SkfB family radical SAM enzyme